MNPSNAHYSKGLSKTNIEEQLVNRQREGEAARFFYSLTLTARENSVIFAQYVEWMHDDATLTALNKKVSRHLPPWHYFAGKTGEYYKTTHFDRLSFYLRTFAQSVDPLRFRSQHINDILHPEGTASRSLDYRLIDAVAQGHFDRALENLQIYFESTESNLVLVFFQRYQDSLMKRIQLGLLGQVRSKFQYYMRGIGVYYTVPLLIVVALKFGRIEQLFTFLDNIMAIPTVRDFIESERGPHPIHYHNLAILWALILKVKGASKFAKQTQETGQTSLGSWESTCLKSLKYGDAAHLMQFSPLPQPPKLSQTIDPAASQKTTDEQIIHECYQWWSQQNPMVRLEGGEDIQLLVGYVRDLNLNV
ncbi:hypothetical protein H4R34_000925 [Dimargaris verticillata]|uniref:Uncharacterized protein n=1 Tax=Dimargaris verticillata TaxID=2761393 RepID=A0A9W8BAY0_9FUNG|nr:hypothetical protein H4R34_000925 [Dimargaris verticillata]